MCWHRLKHGFDPPHSGITLAASRALPRRLMGLGVLLGLVGSVLINVGNNVQALGTELL